MSITNLLFCIAEVIVSCTCSRLYEEMKNRDK